MTTESSQSDTPTLYAVSQGMYKDIRSAVDQCRVDLLYDGHQLELPRVVQGLRPNDYQKFLFAIGDHRLRHSYMNNCLEASPRNDQPRHSRFISRIIELTAYERDIGLQSVGCMTLTNGDFALGIEPDESFYTLNEPKVRCKKVYEPEIDPPPDLVVEIDSPHEVVPRIKVFAKLGVPELWLCKGRTLMMNILRDGNYEPVERSISFPMLTGSAIMQFASTRFKIGDTAAARQFAKWLHGEPAH